MVSCLSGSDGEGESEPQMLNIYLFTFYKWVDQGSANVKKLRSTLTIEDRYKAHCYIIYTAPQYIEPSELEELEKGHPKAPEYIDSEVQSARRQAFWL